MITYWYLWQIHHHRYKEAEADIMQDYQSSLHHGKQADAFLAKLLEKLA